MTSGASCSTAGAGASAPSWTRRWNTSAAIPILIYKLLLGITGMDSPRAYQVVAVLFFLLSVALLFVYARERVGEWLALAGVLPILFLGPSWSDLLFPYQIGFFGSMACGLAALLCLDRRTRSWDVAATVLLCAGLLFSDAGIPFVAGVALEVALGRERFQRAYIVAVPTVLWIVWYLGWGHTAHTFVSVPQRRENLPSYVVDGLSTSLSSWLGLANPVAGTGVNPLSGVVLCWCSPLWRSRFAGTGSAARAIGRSARSRSGSGSGPSPPWTRPIFGPPTASRYIYMGVLLMVLFASEVVKGARIPAWATAAVVAVATAAAVANFTSLRDASVTLATIAQQERGGLAALELARDRVDPGPGAEPAELGRRLPRSGGRPAPTSRRSTHTGPRPTRPRGARGSTGGGPRGGGQGLGRGAADPPGAGDDRGRPALPEGHYLLRANRTGARRGLRDPAAGGDRPRRAPPLHESLISPLPRHVAERAGPAASNPSRPIERSPGSSS